MFDRNGVTIEGQRGRTAGCKIRDTDQTVGELSIAGLETPERLLNQSRLLNGEIRRFKDMP